MFVDVEELEFVFYGNRALSEILVSHKIKLKSDVKFECTLEEEQILNAHKVYDEFDDLEKYLPKASSEKCKASHYLSKAVSESANFLILVNNRLTVLLFCSTKLGNTLVCFIKENKVLNIIHSFRDRVDEVLGKGFYTWFDDKVLHITVRGLL